MLWCCLYFSTLILNLKHHLPVWLLSFRDLFLCFQYLQGLASRSLPISFLRFFLFASLIFYSSFMKHMKQSDRHRTGGGMKSLLCSNSMAWFSQNSEVTLNIVKPVSLSLAASNFNLKDKSMPHASGLLLLLFDVISSSTDTNFLSTTWIPYEEGSDVRHVLLSRETRLTNIRTVLWHVIIKTKKCENNLERVIQKSILKIILIF